MKKKNLVIIFILGLIVVVGVMFLLKDNKSTFSSKNTEFNLEDTSRVDLIVIKERNGKEISLKKQGDFWIVENKSQSYIAHKKQVDLLLNTINRVRVKAPVPKEGRRTILADMASSAKEVIYYEGNKELKHFFIGADTPDNLGTHMLLKDGDEPFIVHIPGFFGYLSSRYTTDINVWRSKYLFTEHPQKISSIEIDYPSEKTKSFHLKKNQNKFLLTHKATSKITEMTPAVSKSYFAQFKDFAVLRFLSEKEAYAFILDPTNFYADLKYVAEKNAMGLRLYKMKQSGMLHGGEDLESAEIDTENFIIEITNADNSKDYAIGASRRLASLFPSYEGFFLNQQP